MKLVTNEGNHCMPQVKSDRMAKMHCPQAFEIKSQGKDKIVAVGMMMILITLNVSIEPTGLVERGVVKFA